MSFSTILTSFVIGGPGLGSIPERTNIIDKKLPTNIANRAVVNRSGMKMALVDDDRSLIRSPVGMVQWCARVLSPLRCLASPVLLLWMYTVPLSTTLCTCKSVHVDTA